MFKYCLIFVSQGIAVFLVCVIGHAAAQPSDTPEPVTYETAQHLVCMRKGKISVDRNPVFRLKTYEDESSIEYVYRDGRVGAPITQFRVRKANTNCTITPSERPDAAPYREYNGRFKFSCRDQGLVLVRPIIAEDIVERMTTRSLVYEYRISNGPPSKQKALLSLDGGMCTIDRVK